MKKLLILKHWQLFSIIALPAILFSATSIRGFAGATCELVFLLWIYSIGYFGQQRLRVFGLNQTNLKLFQINILLLPILSMVSKLRMFAGEPEGILDGIEMILGFYSAFAAFYVFLYVGKTLAKLEYRRQVSFSEYFINALQIIVFIIGVWTLQPRINNQFAKDYQ